MYFYITALNPYESQPSDEVMYTVAGFPDVPGAITEIPQTRTGKRLGV